MTSEDLATILNAHNCVPAYKRQQICLKRGTAEISIVSAKRRADDSLVKIGQWTALNELSYEQVRTLVAEKLAESEVAL